MASLWLLISRDNQPPASVPSTEAQVCPRCGQALRNLMQTLGRKVCDTCGWSDESAPAAPAASIEETAEEKTAEPPNPAPTDDLKLMLQQAAMQSIDNMSPRKKKSQ